MQSRYGKINCHDKFRLLRSLKCSLAFELRHPEQEAEDLLLRRSREPCQSSATASAMKGAASSVFLCLPVHRLSDAAPCPDARASAWPPAPDQKLASDAANYWKVTPFRRATLGGISQLFRY